MPGILSVTTEISPLIFIRVYRCYRILTSYLPIVLDCPGFSWNSATCPGVLVSEWILLSPCQQCPPRNYFLVNIVPQDNIHWLMSSHPYAGSYFQKMFERSLHTSACMYLPNLGSVYNLNETMFPDGCRVLLGSQALIIGEPIWEKEALHTDSYSLTELLFSLKKKLASKETLVLPLPCGALCGLLDFELRACPPENSFPRYSLK